jgi:hypothetical protein
VDESERQRIAFQGYAAMPEEDREQFRKLSLEAAKELCADHGFEFTPEFVAQVRVFILETVVEDLAALVSEHITEEEAQPIIAEEHERLQRADPSRLVHEEELLAAVKARTLSEYGDRFLRRRKK